MLRFENEDGIIAASTEISFRSIVALFSEKGWALLLQTQVSVLHDGAGLGPQPLNSSPSVNRTRFAARYTYHSVNRAYSVSLQPEVLSPGSSENPLFAGPDWLPSLSLLFNNALTPKLNLAQSIRYEHRSNRVVGPLTDSPVWMFDLGTAYLITDRIALLTEAHLHHHLSSQESDTNNSVSLDVGVNLRASSQASIKLGYSRGLTSFPGTPESALFIGMDLQTTSRLKSKDAKCFLNGLRDPGVW